MRGINAARFATELLCRGAACVRVPADLQHVWPAKHFKHLASTAAAVWQPSRQQCMHWREVQLIDAHFDSLFHYIRPLHKQDNRCVQVLSHIHWWCMRVRACAPCVRHGGLLPCPPLIAAYYQLAVYPAWDSSQPITHRYFLCLYTNQTSESGQVARALCRHSCPHRSTICAQAT